LSRPTTNRPQGLRALPAVCVDLCDAKACCESRGKHLCGGKGGNNEPIETRSRTIGFRAAWADAAATAYFVVEP
jgi:hypothetical protein